MSVKWVILTKHPHVIKYAQAQKCDIYQHKNGFYIIISPTNSTAHNIYDKYSEYCYLWDPEKELICTFCKKYIECEKTLIVGEPQDIVDFNCIHLI